MLRLNCRTYRKPIPIYSQRFGKRWRLWVGFMDWTWDMHCVRHATFDQGRSISMVFCPVAESNQARDVHDRDRLVEVLEQSEQKIAIVWNTWMLQFVSIPSVTLLNPVVPLNLKLQQGAKMLRHKMSDVCIPMFKRLRALKKDAALASSMCLTSIAHSCSAKNCRCKILSCLGHSLAGKVNTTSKLRALCSFVILCW